MKVTCCHTRRVPAHSLTWHFKCLLLWCCMCNSRLARQEKGNRTVEKLCLFPVHSRHLWVTMTTLPVPRSSSSTLSGRGTFTINSKKRKPRPPRDLSFYGDGRRLRGGGTKQRKHRGESSGRYFAVGDVLPEAQTLFWAQVKVCALEVLRSLIYSWSSLPCFAHDLIQRSFLHRGSVGSRKG